MRRIPRWVYSVGIRLCVGLWLIFGIAQIWTRVQEMRRPVSRIATTLSQTAGFATAIQTYSLDNGAPPTTEQGLEALIRPPTKPPFALHWDGPYLADTQRLPADEWNRPYIYLSPGPSGEQFMVMSYGKDGKPGGVGEDADIVRTVSDLEARGDTGK
jgi:general secretion pathway protein G